MPPLRDLIMAGLFQSTTEREIKDADARHKAGHDDIFAISA